MRRIEQDMHANASITLAGKTYTLSGLLLHQGSHPESGHWVSIAKHGQRFYLYNASRLSEISEEDLQCSMILDADVCRFYAAALMYERVARDEEETNNMTSPEDPDDISSGGESDVDADRSGITGDTEAVLKRMYGSIPWSTFETAAAHPSARINAHRETHTHTVRVVTCVFRFCLLFHRLVRFVVGKYMSL